MIKLPKMNAALRLFISLAAAGHIAAAHASLGGDSASIEADRLHMNVKHAARLKASSTGSYTVTETTLPTGTLVRQYVSAAGVVFAVAWSGPFMPDAGTAFRHHGCPTKPSRPTPVIAFSACMSQVW